ncbi:MAG: hypothetical protein ACTHOF_08975 [Flavisolibacter sp.]|jgi:hypothetical protein
MKRLFLFILSFSICGLVSAQKNYFIYLESENNLPFYVRMGDKVYSSSTSGYLILPDLTDSSYLLFVGVPSNQAKEARFQINIKASDQGFIIKNSAGYLRLSDLQTNDIIDPLQNLAQSNVTFQPQSNAFTSLLAKAADDSSLLFIPIFAKAGPRKETSKQIAVVNPQETKKVEEAGSKTEDVQSVVDEAKSKTTDTTSLVADVTANKILTDSSAAKSAQIEIADASKQSEVLDKKNDTLQSNNVSDSMAVVQQPEEYKRSTIKKYSESSTSEGFGLVFVDNYEESVDTIRLLIPNPKVAFKDNDAPQKDDGVFLDVKKDAAQQADLKSTDTTVLKKEITSDVKTDRTKDTVGNTSAMSKPQTTCTDMATDNDFFKLRKNMAAKETDEAMVDEAKKFFKNKCYTTGQIKYLSALFLTSAGKYQFFDAAYLHVSDQEKFASLQTEIKDDYYLKRFKALIGN